MDGLESDHWPALRYMTVAGGKLRHDLAAEIARRIEPATFHVMYGQSEATARLASLPSQQLHVRSGSIGRPIWGVELAVMDEIESRIAREHRWHTLCPGRERDARLLAGPSRHD